MTCYRKGGCGPYEYRSCSECPASKPEYKNRVVLPDSDYSLDAFLMKHCSGDFKKLCGLRAKVLTYDDYLGGSLFKEK